MLHPFFTEHNSCAINGIFKLKYSAESKFTYLQCNKENVRLNIHVGKYVVYIS